MSTQQNPKQEQQRRRDEESRLNVSHLAQTSAAVKDKDDEDEDWGDVPAPRAGVTKPVSPPVQTAPVATKPPVDLEQALEEDEDEDLAEDDLERELAGSADEDEDEEEDEEVNETREAPVARVEERQEAPAQPVQQMTQSFDSEGAMRQIEQLQSNLPALTAALEGKLKEIGSKRKALDAEERNIKSRINFLRVLSGQPPLSDDDEEDEDEAPRRRGGRRKAEGTAPATTPAATTAPATAEGEEEERPRGRGGRGKRHHNDQTLKQAICKVLTRMVHPTSGKPFTGFVNDITQKVIKEEGYKSTSAKPTNTVRIQMYRLEDEGKVRQNDDNSYTLRKSVVRELGVDPDQPVATTAAAQS
jgi:hypothetical protein